MATDDSADRSCSSRRPRSDLGEEDEIEEGEFVAGSDTDDGSRYLFQHRRDGGLNDEGRPEIKRRRLEAAGIVLDGSTLPSPTPSSECDSDGTISDIDADDDGAAAAALARERSFPCSVCRREFRNMKAVCGHMRTHALQDPNRRHKGKKERPLLVPAISAGWGVTGKRGSVGGRSVSPESQGEVDSMAIVVAQPVIDPMPIAFARRSSSVEPSPTNDDSMAIVVAADNAPVQNQIVVHPTCSPQFSEAQQPAAPLVAFASPQPAIGQPTAPQIAVGNLQQAIVQGQLVAPPQILEPAAHQVQRAAPPARDEQGWWICKEEGCNHRYATHQGLGGHMAGHKNRLVNEAAAAGLHLGVGDAPGRPEKLHKCKHCTSVFNSGVKLGGHMRKHYPGKVIPKKRAAGSRPQVSAGELASALGLSMTMPPVAMEVAPAVASVAQVSPVVPPGVLRIFGVNIVPAGPPAAAAAAASEEVSSAVPPAAAAAAEEVYSVVLPAVAATAAAEEVSSAMPLAAAASAEEVSSAVPPSAAAAAAAEEVSSAVPPAAAAVEEVSSAVTETDQSSAASTNNIQEQ